uniref:SAP domain-containing protein n=1 Tax=Amblyomma maculatum TaxID=34609 RepID=G3ML06_AMBMU
MADSVDVAAGGDSIRNMKVADLKKELKSRGLPITGNKSELTERLENALGLPKDINDVQLDEGLDQGVDVNEDEALLEESLLLPTEGKANNGDVFAREEELLASTPVSKEPPDTAAKLGLETSKLGAPASTPATTAATTTEKSVTAASKDSASGESDAKKTRVKVTAHSESTTAEEKSEASKVLTKGISAEERIALRSKKFNMPMSDTARLKVRMERFGAAAAAAAAQSSPAAAKDPVVKTSSVKLSRTSITANPPPVDLAKLKKRAERFGQSVSTVAKDLEEKERLLKRKQRFTSTTPAPDSSKKAKTITI